MPSSYIHGMPAQCRYANVSSQQHQDWTKACMRLLLRRGLICSRGFAFVCRCAFAAVDATNKVSGTAFVFMQGILAAIQRQTPPPGRSTAVGQSACHPNPRCSRRVQAAGLSILGRRVTSESGRSSGASASINKRGSLPFFTDAELMLKRCLFTDSLRQSYNVQDTA